MTSDWKHIKTIVDGQRFKINGLNIWDFRWINTGEKINVKDPLYGKPYSFTIYKIERPKIKIIFAAGEFSNCIWGIYQRKEDNKIKLLMRKLYLLP